MARATMPLHSEVALQIFIDRMRTDPGGQKTPGFHAHESFRLAKVFLDEAERWRDGEPTVKHEKPTKTDSDASMSNVSDDSATRPAAA